MTEHEIWDLHASEKIKEQYKKLGRNFLYVFSNRKLIPIKDASTEQIINEINLKKSNFEYKLVSEIIINILENELLFRRKEKIDKIQKNILKKQNILVYLYNLIKKYATKNKR